MGSRAHLIVGLRQRSQNPPQTDSNDRFQEGFERAVRTESVNTAAVSNRVAGAPKEMSPIGALCSATESARLSGTGSRLATRREKATKSRGTSRGHPAGECPGELVATLLRERAKVGDPRVHRLLVTEIDAGGAHGVRDRLGTEVRVIRDRAPKLACEPLHGFVAGADGTRVRFAPCITGARWSLHRERHPVTGGRLRPREPAGARRPQAAGRASRKSPRRGSRSSWG